MEADRPLDSRRIELWCACLDDIDAENRWSDYERLCDARERERSARLRVPAVRRSDLATRALVRTVLSHYAPVDPQAWHFQADAYGRPRIIAPVPPPVEFTISHSEALVSVAVARGRAVGVDVESLQRGTDTVALERYFAPAERAALAELPESSRRRRFFELWTLKEAYLKARGVGLRLPLSAIAFEWTESGRITPSWTEAPADDPPHWAFAQFTPREHYVLAVCAERHESVALELRVHETVPLVWTRPLAAPLVRAVGIEAG